MKTMAELKAVNKANGMFWFSKQTMSIFKSKVHGGIIGEKYFITSECGPSEIRKWSIRTFDEKGDIDTVGDFRVYLTLEEARQAARLMK